MRDTANYTYYETGALKRVELADGIQGIDYVYNLQGQLKAINHPNLTKSDDPGGDDSDLFGMTLDYYSGDYVRYNRFSQLGSNQRVAVDQFNGNIKGITWNTKQGTTIESPLQYLYAYDRNNWLKSAQFIERDKKYPSIPSNLVLEKPEKTKTIIKASESITLKPGFTATANSSYSLRLVVSDPKSDYKVSNITYDANGNIQTLMRNKDSENDNNRMDDLTYVYDTHKPNRLRQVVDAVTVETNANDIKTQPKYNYSYNSIGQLYYNRQEGLFYAYNAAGLVTDVRKNGVLLVRFYYNDRGQRVKKLSYVNGRVQTSTHYVRDVAGSVMAIYENKTLTEHPIYGASRLGVYKRKSKTSLYQLTDHLGNVRAVIAKKGSNAAALVAKTDYYPGGMAMPNKNVKGDYRYNYQGQEQDEETGHHAFELRMYDSRINRWLSPDPAGQYHSPYMSMGNNWISRIDPDGGEDYYRDADGNIIYDETINNEKEFLESGKIGKYLGKTYQENNTYYSLFGRVVDLGTMEGKLYQKIDEAIFNYASTFYDAYGDYDIQWTNMDIGFKNKTGVLSSTGDNLYNFNYYGGRGTYQVYGKDGMFGLLDRGSGKFNQNKNTSGMFQPPPGYNLKISNSNSTNIREYNIVIISFPSKELYNRIDKAIDYDFFDKSNPNPIIKTMSKRILKN